MPSVPRILLLTLLAALPQPGRAALPPPPDSLRRVLLSAPAGPARVDALLRVARAFQEPLDSLGMVSYAGAAERLARQLGDSVRLGQALDVHGGYFLDAGDARRAAPLLRQARRLLVAAPAATQAGNFDHLGELHQNLGQAAVAQAYYRQAYAQAGQASQPAQQAAILLHLGSNCQQPGRYDSAAYFCLQALHQYQRLGRPADEALALTDLGRVYYLQQDLPAAVRCVRQAYALMRQTSDTRNLGETLSALGTLALAGDSPRVALGHYRHLLRLMRQEAVYGQLSYAYKGLATAHERLQRPDSAEWYYRRAVAAQQSLDRPGVLGAQLNNLARFFLQQRRYAEARAWATRTLALDGGREHPVNTPAAWEILRLVADRQGDLPTAYRLLQQQQALQLRLQAQENERLTADLRVGYETERAEQQVTLLTQASELSRLRQQRQLTALIASILATLLLSGGALWAYRRRQQRQEAVLRTRLAADLHDDVGALLSRIALQTDLLQEDLGVPAAQQTQLAEVAENSRLAVRQLNDVVWNLDAENDSVPNLLNRLRDYAHDVLMPTGRDVCFVADEAAVATLALPALVRRQLYLIYKEALHNILKYAPLDATVTVTLHRHGPTLGLDIVNGGPVLTAGAGRSSGHGLRNMETRAAALGGTASAGPRAEGGFAVRVKVPVG